MNVSIGWLNNYRHSFRGKLHGDNEGSAGDLKAIRFRGGKQAFLARLEQLISPAPKATGEEILAGRQNFGTLNGIDDWVGGVHLESARNRAWFSDGGTLISS